MLSDFLLSDFILTISGGLDSLSFSIDLGRFLLIVFMGMFEGMLPVDLTILRWLLVALICFPFVAILKSAAFGTSLLT